MTDSLLPPNSTPFELAVEQVVAERFDALPVHHRFNVDPMRCDVALLPFLARDLSVDVWQESWSEDQKRRVIAASLDVHRHKGTVYAVKKAVAAVNAEAQVVEWFTQHIFKIAQAIRRIDIDQNQPDAPTGILLHNPLDPIRRPDADTLTRFKSSGK